MVIPKTKKTVWSRVSSPKYKINKLKYSEEGPMTSLKVLRITAAVVSSGGLLATSGLAVHAAPYAWTHHQPTQTTTNTQVDLTKNKTAVNVVSNNPQNAQTGSVTVTSGHGDHHHDSGSSTTATSGGASNTSGAIFKVNVSSGGASSTNTSNTADMPSTTTGNTKTTNTMVTGVDNNTSLNVVNNNAQNAQSGKVTVQGNGGNATSGDALNKSNSDIEVTVASY